MSDVPVTHLLSVQQAIAILDAAPVQPRMVRLPLVDAVNLRLAQSIVADRDYPPFDKAVMDGFAVRVADISLPGVELVVIDTIAAGRAGIAVGSGEAAAIMTGAPMPAGADTVVPVEHTSRTDNRVRINTVPKAGNAIARRGSDTVAGRILLEPGTRLGSAQVAVAGSVGAAMVSVYARPIVAVLSTGDELVEIDQIPTGPQIRNSNSIMLVSLLRELGCEVRHVAHVSDTMEAVLSTISLNLYHDALFITGGMSMGEFDFVPRALIELGAKLEISKLKIKPGKPFVYTRLGWTQENASGTCHIFGLPGNPVSAYVCTVRLATRILNRIAGGPPDGPIIHAALTTDLPGNGPRELYLPSALTGNEITPLSPNGSADIFTLAKANALLIRGENAATAKAGDLAAAIRIMPCGL